MAEEIVFVDRYSACGIPYPDPATMCKGDCEGMGFVPICADDDDPRYRERWAKAHAKEHRFAERIRVAWKYRRLAYLWEGCDGYHFVTCADCNGTRLAAVSLPTNG